MRTYNFMDDSALSYLDSSDDEESKAAKAAKKRKEYRSPIEKATKDALLSKRARIAEEVALGPMPVRWAPDGSFLPWLMPEGLFDHDRPGEIWAAHHRYPPTEVLVSSYGVVCKRGRHADVGEYEYFHIGCAGGDGYRSIQFCDGPHDVHVVVCEAFHGPKPQGKRITVDHIDRDRSNNKASNLRWATHEMQLENQQARRTNSTSVPILARKAGSDDEWIKYQSSHDANKALGINSGNIIKLVDKEGRSIQGYEFRTDFSSLEIQTDLPREELGPTHARFCVPTEQWKIDPESNGRTRVSTRGRVQTKNTTGDDWGPKRTPRACFGMVYATVNGIGVHLVVWRTFCPSDPCAGDDTIDHIDQDKSNNALYNLRRASRSMQMRNRTMPLADDQVKFRRPILAWKSQMNTEFPERFISVHAAERALRERFPGTNFTNANMCQSAKKNCRHFGWHFAYESVTGEEKAAHEAERQRVLTAIAALREQGRAQESSCAE